MGDEVNKRDLSVLVVRDVGRLDVSDDPWEPVRLLDLHGVVVDAVAVFLRDLQAADRSGATLRSYGNDLLRWWRFLDAVEVRWERATQAEGRDFARWMRIADKPLPGRGRQAAGDAGRVPGKYSAATRAHAETVLRTFYDFHLVRGSGPIVNPFPLDRSHRRRRPDAHHNPMEPFRNERRGRYRPKVPQRIPRRIPDDQFTEVFAGLKHHRDRALLAFWVSTAARSEELLTVPQSRANPGDQLIGVIRKGTRTLQWLPASPDAFVWLRLYQQELWAKGGPRGRNEPLWLTLRRPWRQLAYPAARAMFIRAQQLLGTSWTLHDLRHTAAWRMAQDPEMPLTDVQWILAHASLSTTQLYTMPSQDEVVAHVLAHHEPREANEQRGQQPPPAPGYNPASLDILFGGNR